MTRDQIDQMAERIQQMHCPACGHRALYVTKVPTKSRKAYHSLMVKCLHCAADAKLWGLTGWKNSRAENVLVEEFKKERDRRVAKELMSCQT